MKVLATWKETKQPVVETKEPMKIIRSDTRTILAECYGDAITDLVVVSTVQKVLPDGTKATIYSKSSASVGDGVVVTEISPDTYSKVTVPIIDKADTGGFEAGDIFVFDVEFTTTAERATILGNFTLVEDRTLN